MPASARAPAGASASASLRADAGQIRLGERLVAYALNRRRRRSIGFVVGPQGLTINAPNWLGRDEIDAALQAKSRWILTKLDEQRERSQRVDAARVEWRDGGTLQVLGRATRIMLGGTRFALSTGGPGEAVEASMSEGVAACPEATPFEAFRNMTTAVDPPGAPAAAAIDARLIVPLPGDAAPAQIEAAVCRWLQAEARRLYAERVARHAPRLGVRPAALRLSSARTRWGSASADGTIRLNWRLIHLPVECIDYVVVHELAHLREMNHGPRFWALVAAVLPDYEAMRRTLRNLPIPTPDRQ